MPKSMFPDRKQLDMTPPAQLAAIQAATETLGFDMPSIPQTGALLRALAASKPAARVLELGTGTGIATCWLLDGLDDDGSGFIEFNELKAALMSRPAPKRAL